MQRYLEEGLPHLVTQHGRDFGSGAALLAAAVSGAPIRHAPAFIAARTDGDGGGGPCVNPQAVEALLTELAAVPLTQVGLLSLCSNHFCVLFLSVSAMFMQVAV